MSNVKLYTHWSRNKNLVEIFDKDPRYYFSKKYHRYNDYYGSNDRFYASMKPPGLWFGINNSWKEWCDSENFNKGNHLYILNLEKANLYKINSHDQLLKFTKEFEKSIYPDISELKMNGIDWQRLMKDFDGIEISPYIFSARLDHDTFWYYTWDVSSGTIWNLEHISIHKATTEEKRILVKEMRLNNDE